MTERISDIAQLTLTAAQRHELGIEGDRLSLRRVSPRKEGLAVVEYSTPQGSTVPGRWVWNDSATPGRRAEELLREVRDAAGGVGGVALVGRSVVLQSGGRDEVLEGLSGALGRPGARLVVHQPGRRAVVRAPGPNGVEFTKIMRCGPARRAAESARAVLPGAPIPRLLSIEPAEGRLTWSEAPGRRMFDVLGEPGIVEDAAATGRALRRLHDLPAPSLPSRGPESERGALSRWSEFLAATAPERFRDLRRDLAGAHERMLSFPSEISATTHGDLHEKQIFVDGRGRSTLIDTDGLARGDPAADLGNLTAHFALRVRQGLLDWDLAGRAASALVGAYRPRPAVMARIEAYAFVSRVRLACVYAARPRWADRVAGLASEPFLPGVLVA